MVTTFIFFLVAIVAFILGGGAHWTYAKFVSRLKEIEDYVDSHVASLREHIVAVEDKANAAADAAAKAAQPTTGTNTTPKK
jgi:hypothetical protein